jgi:hypothetical protein
VIVQNVPSDARQEIKFVTNDFNFYMIINWIKLHGYGFIKNYDDRWINNIYFDTYDYSNYAANLSGQSSRKKIRYRWYGKKLYPSIGSLEVKIRRNFFGWKKVYPVTNDPYSQGGSWKSIINNISNQLPLEASIMLNSCANPIIINRYKRAYFVSIDGKIRITVDRFQQAFDQRFKPYPEFTKESNQPDTIVIEVKFDRRDNYIANKVIQGLPVRVSRHSKYMNSVDSVSGNRA